MDWTRWTIQTPLGLSYSDGEVALGHLVANVGSAVAGGTAAAAQAQTLQAQTMQAQTA